MPKKKSWTIDQLRKAVNESHSIRGVLRELHLVPAGGNYEQVKWAITDNNIDISHFKGKGWNKGLKYQAKNRTPTSKLLVKNSRFQSYKLKRRLFQDGYKEPRCELCGWNQKTTDGRVPVELDHINGDHYDNRIENLRVLCPNCHSLQLTHRGRNKKSATVNKNLNS